uniref:Annexin n=1 Tax=Trieres chinensis TaxID=1514140 RepID=A0A7S2ENR1_TRICV|mmetsp:Transcript_32031/g.65383  ORF Transcript_32031/g.65383 Transcript_32031/m.65383 type:complete len:331 (+) Transcript_32031:139-1131(+)|eukprot:CAMPEP_0183322880 /NCGR_PEP_ID=MMETSP0160_2-20130417/72906_1 /TAXON_ID=2839 ORGANISM="Odontella Sinensis, Strain Grunow 1884" /NCGR_SAMPLE_ID=MMETSP0160_2 /ASSEMBLY_ACC=CAM_ASM_000250 /LENGTH=330 /DNA_ID=CAMNT_0025490141 /DNA_START=66 /DNA_END=1058 /DNA_ORIENTATION=+
MSLNLYPDLIHTPDLTPEFPPEIDEACDAIRKATKGFGTSEKKLIKAMAVGPAERTLISIRYEQTKGKALEDLMKKECGGDFGEALRLLALPPDAADARILKMATDGIGASKKYIYPVVCGRSNEEIEILKKTYYKKYGKDLSGILQSELGGDFERLVIESIQGVEEGFDPGYHTQEKAQEDAETFYEAGQGRWGTNEKKLIKILVASPPEHLRNINQEYAEKYGYTLTKALEKELGGALEEAALFVLGMKLKPFETVADLIKQSCAGVGTDEMLLTACIVRYQSILPQVMVAHMEMFGKSVQDRVKKETGGDYEKLLLALLNRAIPDDA